MYMYKLIDFQHSQTKKNVLTKIYFCRGQVGMFWDVMDLMVWRHGAHSAHQEAEVQDGAEASAVPIHCQVPQVGDR